MENLRKGMLLPLLLLLLVAAAGGAGTTDRYETAMQERITVEAYQVEDDETLTASVSMPDYSAYMLQFLEEAEQDAQDEGDFGSKLYALVAAATAEAENTCTRDITVSLSETDPEKSNWSEAELMELAREAAFRAEVEEFCIELLAELYPDADEVNLE